ncbi:MAG: alpha/beta hydrolase fold domain-containing protein [Pseudomonadota bacterium]
MSDESLPGAVPSTAARAILAEPVDALPDLTAANMPNVRAEIRAFFEPAVQRALAASGVETTQIRIAGVPCLEVLPPQITADWPILYGYGGGYMTGSPYEDLIIAAPMAAATGARVIIPHYRLAPEHPWPAAPDDGFAVYRALAENPFALVGESAGGNLAMVCLLRAQKAGLPMPGAAALLSPWCDLSGAGDSLRANDGRDPFLSAAYDAAASAFYAGEHPRTDPDISPVYGAYGPGLPPVLITTGTRDLLLSHAIRAEHVLRAAGAATRITIWEDLWHVFEFDDRLPEAALSLKQIAEFITAHMS